MKSPIFSCLVLIFGFSHTLSAQICMLDQTPQSIAAVNFELNYNNSGGAEIQDKMSGLVWQRCVYGQTWQGTRCEGLPQKLSWQEALQTATATNWRVPDIKELSSILDLQCIAPPLNDTIFPGFPASEDGGLWSSTPQISGITPETQAWWVDLFLGKMDFREVSSKNFVLFVKNP